MLVRTPKLLGQLIADRRKEMGLTQTQLAERVGVSRFWVYQIERGKSNATFGLVLGALSELGLEMDIRRAEAEEAGDGAGIGLHQIQRVPLTRRGRHLKTSRGRDRRGS